MIDVRTATLQQLRDYIAERNGWKCEGMTWRSTERWTRGTSYVESHPYPGTLDAAARAMPEGWGFEFSYTNWWTDVSEKHEHQNALRYQGVGYRMTKNYDDPDGDCVITPCCTDPVECMYRLAALCWQAQEGTK